MYSRLFRCRCVAAYTLIEVMVAAAIMAVGMGVVYPIFVGNFGLYARNLSINKSNNSLRASLQQLKRDVDMAIEPPTLATFRMNGSSGVLKPQISTVVSAPAIIIWRSLGPVYKVSPTGGSSYATSVNTTSSITLTRATFNSSDNALESPLPQVGDRLVILSPSPYSNPAFSPQQASPYDSMADVVTMDGATIQKPGRLITGVSMPDTTANRNTANFTVTIDQGSPRWSTLVTPISAPQSVIIVREVAYAAYTINDAAGKPVERQLLYYPSTYDMTNQQLLIRDLDPDPKEVDTNTSAVVQPFNYYGGKGKLSAMNVILPIRAVDYASSIADRNLNGNVSGTSPSEFNVYLRSSVAMRIKARLD